MGAGDENPKKTPLSVLYWIVHGFVPRIVSYELFTGGPEVQNRFRD